VLRNVPLSTGLSRKSVSSGRFNINLICAASFIAAVGDPRRFLTGRKLVAYLGLDPKVRQSGDAPARSGRISKRGSAAALGAGRGGLERRAAARPAARLL
jgi:transposase